MERKIKRAVLACIIVLALAVSSCGARSGVLPEELAQLEPGEMPAKLHEAEELPQYGGMLVVDGYPASSLEPTQRSYNINPVLSITHERLGRYDWGQTIHGSREIEPSALAAFGFQGRWWRRGNLAESWEMPDVTTITFHLREGVHFHNLPPVDGREFTADDVVFSWHYYFAADPPEASFESVTALDRYTVEFKYNRYAFDRVGLAWWWPYVLAYEMVEEGGGDLSEWKESREWEDLINVVDGSPLGGRWTCAGTGPFVVQDWVPGSSAIYERNPDYWGYDECNPENSLPYVDVVRLVYMPDATTRKAALIAGKLSRLRRVLPDDALDIIRTRPQLMYTSGRDNTARPNIMWRMDVPPFDDIRVRRALKMAIDRDAIIRGYYHGWGDKFAWPVSPDWEGIYVPLEEQSEEVQQDYTYNPEMAKQLLGEAGYPNGFNTEIICPTGLINPLSLWVSYWDAIGVKCKLRPAEIASFYNEVYVTNMYPQMYASWHPVLEPELGLAIMTGGWAQSVHYFEDRWALEAVDLLYLDREFEDDEKRTDLLRRLGMRWYEQAWGDNFPIAYSFNFWQPWLKGYAGEYALGTGLEGPLYARVWVDVELQEEMGHAPKLRQSR